MQLPLKTIIVEDRPDDRTALKSLLDEKKAIFNPYIFVTSYGDAIDILTREKFALSILDVDLDKGKDCYDLIDNIKREQFGIIALNTINHEQLGDKIENVGEFIWFPKPYSRKGMNEFIIKIKWAVEKINNSTRSTTQLTSIENQIIWAPTSANEMLPLTVGSIIYCESNNQYTTIHCLDKSNGESTKLRAIITSYGLGVYEELLTPFNFCRIHNKYLVNIAYIEVYKKDEAIVNLKNGPSLIVSDSGRGKLSEAMLLRISKKTSRS